MKVNIKMEKEVDSAKKHLQEVKFFKENIVMEKLTVGEYIYFLVVTNLKDYIKMGIQMVMERIHTKMEGRKSVSLKTGKVGM